MLLLLLVYPLYAGVMYAKQTAILFPAASDKHHALDAVAPTNAQAIEIPASFGQVRAIYWHPEHSGNSHSPAILYLHGNFECVQDSFDLLAPLVARGFPVLQVEFPGFCGADGSPTFEAVNEAAEHSYDWLIDHGPADSQNIVAMGYSMGGGAAAELTAHRHVDSIVLLSTYTSIEDIAHRYGLPGFLVRTRTTMWRDCVRSKVRSSSNTDCVTKSSRTLWVRRSRARFQRPNSYRCLAGMPTVDSIGMSLQIGCRTGSNVEPHVSAATGVGDCGSTSAHQIRQAAKRPTYRRN